MPDAPAATPARECVKIAPLPGAAIGVRDSKYATGPVLAVTCGQWRYLLHALRNHTL
ncbi:DUF397 domain-containing protein [Actinomadura kijaniata]|uniref:DUF397 domain-containing protein n=1 Tax=Actinomadura kijaniata TaxID=46161 RepID=UPI003F1ACC15